MNILQHSTNPGVPAGPRPGSRIPAARRLRPRSASTVVRAAALAAVLAVSVATPAAAFHRGGAGACAGCHVLHPSRDGTVVITGGEPLLLAATATDVCLMCHGGDQGVLGHNPLSPPPERGAGNFVFLLEDNLNDTANGQGAPIGGAAAGHNILSVEWGLQPDPERLYAPGGLFPADQLGCTSCHDPHGNAEFRMLNGVGFVQGGSFEFRYPAPQATGLNITDPLDVEADDRHTAYRSGMSDWCANCHGRYHDDVGRARLHHDFDGSIDSEQAAVYNEYNGTADPKGGVSSQAYIAAVPFEDPQNTIRSTGGPTAVSTVMCLTCHRAHASSGPHAGRWDFNLVFLAEDGQVSGSYPIPSPYPDPDQNSLCNKCHNGMAPASP